MEKLTLQEICDVCNGEFYGDISRLEEYVTGVVIDSRQVVPGNLFVALPGERVDGHDFIGQVLEKGALAALSQKIPSDYETCILVSDTRKALQDLAAYYLGKLGTKVVGITGSVGKTSTKEVIAGILSQKFKVLKTEKNYNGQLGLPLTVLKLTKEHEIAVLEMGISLWGEMPRIAQIAKPDIMVITNIGNCHLEAFGDRDGVLKAKTEAFQYMKENGIAVLCGDDDKLSGITSVCGNAPVFYGMNLNNAVRVTVEETMGLKGTRCVIHGQKGDYQVRIPVPGDHQISNTLAATAVAELLGLNDEEIRRGIAKIRPLAGRGVIMEGDRFMVIDDCYNANPASMSAALRLLARADTRKVAILGDMFELGEKERELHYEMGCAVAETGIDVLICLGNLAEEIAKGALDHQRENKPEVHYVKTKNELFTLLPKYLKDGDSILVKASNGMKFYEIVDALFRSVRRNPYGIE